jgi:type II secretory pathway component PulF
MPSFSYTARDSAGAAVTGRLEAANRKEALRQLSGRGLVPVRLDESAAGPSAEREGSAPGAAASLGRLVGLESGEAGTAAAKLSRKQRLPFLRALADLVGCGVQTGDAVRMLARRLSSGPQKSLAAAVWSDLSQGRSLSNAMRAHPRVFDEASISLVEAGEATGNLAGILRRLVADLEDRAELQRKLAAAMAYPLFIVIVAMGVVLVFLFFLLPRIQMLLTSLGGRLPLTTRLLVGLSEFLVVWGPVLALAFAAGSVTLWAWRKKPAGREAIDRRVLGLPLVGPFLRDADLLRLVQTLALLLENGITTITALTLTERTILNTTVRRAFSEARAKIAEGAPISTALRDTRYFADLVMDILMIGDNTGNIVPGLQEVARFYRRRQQEQLGFFVGALSIGVLLVAFVFVALIAFGVILAVFQLSANLSVR